MSEDRPLLLVLSTTFPRWQNDTEPRFVLDLCRELADRYRITVLAPHCAGALVREQFGDVVVERYRYAPARLERLAYDGGIAPRLRQSPWTWLLVPLLLLGQMIAVCRVLRREPVAVIHAHWLIPQAWCALVGRWLCAPKVPVLCTVHGADLYAFKGAMAQRLQRSLANRCQCIAAVSTAVRTELLARGVRPEIVQVMPMGIAEHAFAEESRASAELLFVGRLVEKKGLDILLSALPSVLAQHPQVQLTVVGNGPMLAAAKQQVSQMQLEDCVTFVGPLPHAAVLQHFRRAAVTVVPSRIAADGDTEGLGLVALEAMSSGCPVVVADLPALTSFVEAERTALVVPRDDPRALAAALTRLLGDAELRQGLGAQGKTQALQQFGWNRCAQRYTQQLASLAAA